MSTAARQAPGETVIFHGHPCWRATLDLYAKGTLTAVLAGIAAGLASAVAAGHVQIGWIVLAVVVVLVAVGAAGLIRRLGTTYTITSRRLTIHRGLLTREVHETRLQRIQNVASRQTLVERMLGIGTVRFHTAGEDYQFAFEGVSNPRRIARLLTGALSDAQREDLSSGERSSEDRGGNHEWA